MARHTNGIANQANSRRTKQQKAFAHTEAEVAWQEMYRRRRSPAKTRGQFNRSIIWQVGTSGFHATKGYRGALKRA